MWGRGTDRGVLPPPRGTPPRPRTSPRTSPICSCRVETVLERATYPEGPGSGGAELPAGDVLVTDAAGVGLVVLTADCVPVALADPVGGRLTVVHAGWRGLARGVIQAALSGLEHPGRAVAAIGPAVGIDHYEVGDDVAAAVSAGTGGAAVVQTSPGDARPSLDL